MLQTDMSQEHLSEEELPVFVDSLIDHLSHKKHGKGTCFLHILAHTSTQNDVLILFCNVFTGDGKKLNKKTKPVTYKSITKSKF